MTSLTIQKPGSARADRITSLTDLEIMESMQLRLNTCSTCEHWNLKGSTGDISKDYGKCETQTDPETELPISTKGDFVCPLYEITKHLQELIDGTRKYLASRADRITP